MRRHLRLWPLVPIAVGLLALALFASPVWAGMNRGVRAENGEAELEFEEAVIYFELNDTDGDLGIHALIDGDPWKRLTIEAPGQQEELQIRLRGGMRTQGLTELFFESAEPPFDELDPADFFLRFPEGEYEVDGITIEGEEVESTVEVTHLMPAPPENFEVNGSALPEDCDDGPVPSVSAPFNVSWDAVTMSHPDIGRTGEPIEVDRYELVVEREEPELVKYGILLPPGVTSVQIPAGLVSSGDEVKIEILVREASGNQTAIESCFEVD